MNVKTRKPLHTFSRRMLLILVILGGWLFIIALEYAIGTRAGLLKAKERLEAENAYIAAQCIRYDEVASEEKTKSLIRIADKALRLQRIYREDEGILNEEFFLEYMESFRLTGMSGLWTEILGLSASVSGCPGKVYSERFFVTTVITTITRWFPDWTNPG